MLSDISVSRQLGLVFTDLLLRTTGLPACSLLYQSDLTSWEVNLPTPHSLRNLPSASVVPKVTNRQGGIANELIKDSKEAINSVANIAAIYVGC
jgi:hypothetical protein